MRQRALIAMALACEPRAAVADEPTTALDVTVQAQILDLLHELRAETGMALLLVTHDLGVAAESVDEVLVMQHGRAVERGPVDEVLRDARASRTRGPCWPRCPRRGRRRRARPPRPRPGEPLLDGRPACARRRSGGRARGRAAATWSRAVDGVSLTVRRGETLGVVGESGSGKTTLGRMLVRLLDPTAGTVTSTAGRRPAARGAAAVRRELQMVFQDPVVLAQPAPQRSASPIADPLRAARARATRRGSAARVGELLERVGLDAARYDRYPHEFSGGQRQRVGIARALAAEPELIVCDEPVSALDVTTQAQVIALLAELQRELGLALVFVAHDLAVVRQVSDRVAVMRRRSSWSSTAAADEVYAAPAGTRTPARSWPPSPHWPDSCPVDLQPALREPQVEEGRAPAGTRSSRRRR